MVHLTFFSCDFYDNVFFLLQIAVRSGGGDDQVSQQLTNEKGEVTSHLQGMFYRTIRMLTHGIKPCFVFDGKPPVLKSGELAKRKENREKAAEELKKAEEADNKEDIDKVSQAPHNPHQCVFVIGCDVTVFVLFVCDYILDFRSQYNRRLVRVSKQENDDCKQLLTLMGVPIVHFPAISGGSLHARQTDVLPPHVLYM